MSDIIRLLPDSVANQIAAGEVIQRPASVIKELVENSIDAGATHIQVVVEDAGKSLVQVIDNGKGMSETDARLSFERHATSKIRQASDLFALQTMGFRGEALASIAAVAQVELRTRPAANELGVCLCIEGSKVKEQTPVSCPPGANFAVRNLFFNIPARRKFLKSNQTELSNIVAEFERIALAHPDIAFSLMSGGTMMLNLAAGNFRRRIIDIFGRNINARLIPVEVDTTLAHISGFVGTPDSARKKNARRFFFANGRFMRHPYFEKAVLTAFERLIGDGEQVPFFLNFEVDPARIDVNIHPTKTEIKFEDEAAIWQILLAAVREALNKSGAVPTIDFDTESRPDIPSFNPANEAVRPPEVHLNRNFNPFNAPASPAAGDESDFPSAAAAFPAGNVFAPADGEYAPPASAPAASAGFAASGADTFASRVRTDVKGWRQVYDAVAADAGKAAASPAPLYADLPADEQTQWNATSGDYLQYKGRYIITAMKSGLVMVDLHRASVRIAYDRYLRGMLERAAPSQRLLFPQILQVSPSEQPVFERLLDNLTAVGFDLSPLGGTDYSVLAAPAGTEGLDPAQLLLDILHDAVKGESNAAETVGHIIAFGLARKVAIPVGQALSQDEMSKLIAELFAGSTPGYTPDGRPTLALLSQEQIERLFA